MIKNEDIQRNFDKVFNDEAEDLISKQINQIKKPEKSQFILKNNEGSINSTYLILSIIAVIGLGIYIGYIFAK